jgi:dTDP-4-amino-4,6-dideoxygalactose transaminase
MLSPHPTATVRDLSLPRSRKPTLDLLNAPGLELTYNARGALLRACTEIAKDGKREILLPAFHCPSGITPAIRAGLTPVFYRIRRDLTVDYDDLLSKVGPNTGAVLVIHFFGIPTDLEPLTQVRKTGIALIEDWSHSFLQSTPPKLAGTDSDYRIYSFWKLIPSGVGGGLLRGNSRITTNPSAANQPAPLKQQIINFKRLLEEALNHSNYWLARTAFSQAEQLRLAFKRSPAAIPQMEQRLRGEDRYPFDPRLADSTMPTLSRKILESSDLSLVAQRRRTNFALYCKLLSDLERLQVLYPTLPEEACPWVFPVLLQGRNDIDHRWRDAGVALHTFGIYLHSTLFETADDLTISDARFLANNVLCLAIHQDIPASKIEISASIIRSHLASLPLE